MAVAFYYRAGGGSHVCSKSDFESFLRQGGHGLPAVRKEDGPHQKERSGSPPERHRSGDSLWMLREIIFGTEGRRRYEAESRVLSDYCM